MRDVLIQHLIVVVIMSFAEVLVECRERRGDSGSVWVYSGVDGSLLYTFHGDGNDDELGYSVSGAGDVDNDGFDDVVAGARYDDNNGSSSGMIRVYSGADGSILYSVDGSSGNKYPVTTKSNPTSAIK